MAREKTDYTLIKPSKKKGNYYYRDGSDSRRTKHTTGQNTLAGARAFLEQLRQEKNKPVEQVPEMTFGIYAQRFFTEGCPYVLRRGQEGKPVNLKTLKDLAAYVRNYLVPGFGKSTLRAITPQQVRVWRETVMTGKVKIPSMKNKNGVPPNERTINYSVNCFRIILDQAEEDGLIDKNPLNKVTSLPTTIESPHDALSEEEVKRLFPGDESIVTIWGSNENVVMYLLLFCSGLRSGEIRALRWADVDYNKSGLLLRQAQKADGTVGTLKNKKPRPVILPTSVMVWLKKWELELGNHESMDYVFPGTDFKTSRGKAAILRTFKRVLVKQGIKRGEGDLKLVLHSTRHTYNTMLVNRDQDELARKLLGHQSEGMTKRYLHNSLENDLEAMGRVEGDKVNKMWDEVLAK